MLLLVPDDEARNAYFPGWLQLFAKVERERGWAPPTRQQFDAMVEPEGAYLIGAPDTVAVEMLQASKTLDRVSRITLQMASDWKAGRMKLPMPMTESSSRFRTAQRRRLRRGRKEITN